MLNRFTFLACVGAMSAAVGCGDSMPPVEPGTGADVPPSVTGGSGGGGGTGGMGGAGGMGGGNASIQCVDVDESVNRFDPTFNDVAESYTAVVAFSAWIPDRCDTFRQLTLGFNDDTCSLETGNTLQIVIPESALEFIALGFPYAIRNGEIQMTIRLRIDDRVWGNCLRSNGTLTFVRLELGEDGIIQATLAGTLTDCSADPDTSTVGVSGTQLRVPAPLDCP